ncbi:MAG: hypothetical protein LBF21_02640 [Puniceicoccales bacterium]|jgi:riboflavin kinase/FMN adenylyltransferase|nr:hypothetical protein [Puniceicoccales bacterium]
MEILLSEGEEPCCLPPSQPVVLAIGIFDGVHRGHQRVLSHTITGARSLGGIAAVYTFFPYPSSVVEGLAPKALILPKEVKYARIAALGMDVLIEQRFDQTFSQLSGEQFLSLLRKKIPTLRGLCVGEDFCFGRGRSSDSTTLGLLAKKRGIETQILPSLCSPDEQRISSTRVRRSISAARMELTRELLGRPYEMEGKWQGRGKASAVPSAELLLDWEPELRLRSGLYYVRYRNRSLERSIPRAEEGLLVYPPPNPLRPGRCCRLYPLREAGFSPGDAIRLHCLHYSGDFSEDPEEGPEESLCGREQELARDYFLKKFPHGSGDFSEDPEEGPAGSLCGREQELARDYFLKKFPHGD